MRYFLLSIVLVAGCATSPKRFEIQCVDTPANHRDVINGPVVIDGDSLYFYDAHGKLCRVK